MSNINPIGSASSIVNSFASKPAASNVGGTSDFKNILTDAMAKFEQVGDEDAQATLDLLTGNTDDLSNTMISAQKSEIALNLTIAIRDKAIGAYKEIMSMQV